MYTLVVDSIQGFSSWKDLLIIKNGSSLHLNRYFFYIFLRRYLISIIRVHANQLQ